MVERRSRNDEGRGSVTETFCRGYCSKSTRRPDELGKMWWGLSRLTSSFTGCGFFTSDLK